MVKENDGLGLSREEIEDAFKDPRWADEYPPILTTEQVAKLLQLPLATIYQMSSQGRFNQCATKLGKHLRFYRNRLLRSIFNQQPR